MKDYKFFIISLRLLLWMEGIANNMSEIFLLIIKLFSFLLIIPLYINDSNAQDCEYKLSIQLLDLHDGLPLSNATVEINKLEIPVLIGYNLFGPVSVFSGPIFQNIISIKN